jgi:hypothetical protein
MDFDNSLRQGDFLEPKIDVAVPHSGVGGGERRCSALLLRKQLERRQERILSKNEVTRYWLEPL